MNKLIINICTSSDSFGGFSENCEGIFAAGNSVNDVKKDVLETIRILKEEWPKEQWPQALKED